jgi:hypothetical protein
MAGLEDVHLLLVLLLAGVQQRFQKRPLSQGGFSGLARAAAPDHFVLPRRSSGNGELVELDF